MDAVKSFREDEQRLENVSAVGVLMDVDVIDKGQRIKGRKGEDKRIESKGKSPKSENKDATDHQSDR